jgi:hypothetical protein
MASDVAERGSGSGGWRPRPFGLLMIAVADFCAAVGIGNVFFGQSAAGWFVAAAVVLLVGISTMD